MNAIKGGRKTRLMRTMNGGTGLMRIMSRGSRQKRSMSQFILRFCLLELGHMLKKFKDCLLNRIEKE